MGMLVSVSGPAGPFDVAIRLFGESGAPRHRHGGANAVFAQLRGFHRLGGGVLQGGGAGDVAPGYKPSFAWGVTGSSVMGMLIPPRLLLNLFGCSPRHPSATFSLGGIGQGILLSVIVLLGTC